MDQRLLLHSVDPLAWASGVHFFESLARAFVEKAFGLEALVLIITVGGHASLEAGQVFGAELVEDILTGGVIVFSGEKDDSLIDEGGLLLGTTEHVDHIFHWHGDCVVLEINYY